MKKHFLYILPLALATLGLTSCLDYDIPGDEFNSNQNIGEDEIYHGKPNKLDTACVHSETRMDSIITVLTPNFQQMKSAQYALRGGKDANVPGPHAYQRQYSLGPDLYAQYATVPHHDFMYGELTSSYYLSLDFNGGPMSSYSIVKNYLTPLLNHPLVDSIPEMKAVGLLIHDIAAQEVADLYGPFPYFEYLKNQAESPFHYNPVDSIYYTIEANVDSCIKIFKNYETRPDWYKTRVQGLLYQHIEITNDAYEGYTGFDSYIRLANCLKLRMAMHMTKVEPALAKRWAEEAVAGGVIEDTKHEFALLPMYIGFSHPLAMISESWADTRLSASFCSILKSLNHPYLGYLFTKNTDVLSYKDGTKMVIMQPDSDYIGLREGTHTGVGQVYANNMYCGFSKIKTSDFFSLAPLYIFKYSEIAFLRAEGALRGWNMGNTAQYFYEEGIRYADFADRMMYEDPNNLYHNQLDDYMTQDKAVAYTWKDPMGKDADQPSVTKIGVAWDEGDDNETKLEKIITQKYIALWPNSFEAWGDMRRTGYPKVFPVLNAQEGDGSLFDGDLIRRMPWVPRDEATKTDIQTSGLPALKGFDEQATRLWWDVKDKGNF